MSGRYSHNAYDHAMRDVKREDRQAVGEVLDAMHDREALGLDASVCARTLLAEVHALIAEFLHDNWPRGDVDDMDRWDEMATATLSKFGGGS